MARRLGRQHVPRENRHATQAINHAKRNHLKSDIYKVAINPSIKETTSYHIKSVFALIELCSSRKYSFPPPQKRAFLVLLVIPPLST